MAKFNLNEASLLCKVGKEPEKRSTQSGLVVVSLLCVTIAPEYKTLDGTLIPERKTWHNVIITKSSEMDYILGNVHVGDVVYVEGRVHNRVTEVNGEKRYMLEIECDMFKKIVSQPTENVGTWQKIRIGGGVGRDPEIKTLPSGSKVATFSIATSEGGYVDKNGIKVEEETIWHNLTFWGNKNVDFLEKYVKKGDVVYVDGQINIRCYEKDGSKRYAFEIRGNRIDQIVSKRGIGESTAVLEGVDTSANPFEQNVNIAPTQPVAQPQPVVQPTPQPMAQPTPQPVAQPQPVVQPTPQPVATPSPQPVVQTVAQPAPQPVAQPTTEELNDLPF
jgi:single-strand DNA-binding protein